MRFSLKNKLIVSLATAAGLIAMSVPSVTSAEGLPKSIFWTTHGTTHSGYAQAVAIGRVLKDNFGTSLRIIPAQNDISRMIHLKSGAAGYCACSISSYFSQEGVMQFAGSNWGPQPVRAILTSESSFGFGLAIAKDMGVTNLSGLKGKRVAWIRNADALNTASTAFLAFGGLTWDDVKKVNFPSFKDSIDGIVNGQADAAFTSTVSSHIKRLAASRRGVTWPILPKDNTAAWIRMNNVAPYFSTVEVRAGAEILKDKPWAGAGYPYPILVANADRSTDEVYTLTKVMVENFDHYKDKALGAKGWNIDKQNFEWIIPYHEGAVKYFKEIGKWSDSAQTHQNMLLRRQDVLAAAYKAYKATSPAKDEFKAGWKMARANALASANLTVNFN